MAADIRNISTEAIRTFANRVQGIADEINASADKIQAIVDGTIPMNWSGEAATKFQSNWSQDYAEFQKKKGNFLMMTEMLTQLANDTETAEQEISAIANYHV
jgi:WXG100 family type VII secretion target